jgi:hypothetical protein
LPKATIKESKDLVLTINIQSNTNEKILIPKYIGVGYVQDSSGFICFQLQKREAQGYENVKPLGIFDDLVIVNPLDTLHRNEQREFKHNIISLCIPCKGSYRIRVLCFFSAYNNMKDVYSDWLYFDCEKAVYPSAG